MRVIVLGGGLLGVASAYYLQQLGHEVTVIDRHATPAAEARGLARAPAPRPAKASVRHRRCRAWKAVVEGAGRRLAHLMGYLTGAVHRPAERLEHLVRLGAYSLETVRELRDEAGVSNHPRTAGWMRVYTDARAFEDFVRRVPRLQALGCALHLLSADEAVRLEPALSPLRGQLAGAAFSSEDASRDPAPFAASMIFMCRAAGVRFLMNHTVVKLHACEGRIDHVELANADGDRSTLRAQAYVLALGAAAVPHARELGIALPLRPMREYTVLLPVKDAARLPHMALHDRTGRMRIQRVETPQGERLRVWSSVRAEPEEMDAPDPQRFARMLRRVEALLPGAADMARAEYASTLHRRSASGLPVIGRTPMRNLFLNIAPGASGWVNACGAGKSIARIVSGLSPEVEFAFAKG
jgi:D-amino-acid dehydrogenase